MGHVWDENLEEYNNPLPRWWMWLFWITIVFGLIYLDAVSRPGQLRRGPEVVVRGPVQRRDGARRRSKYEPIFAKYAAMDIPAVAADPQAREMGQRLFLNYCAQCHASDARGGRRVSQP